MQVLPTNPSTSVVTYGKGGLAAAGRASFSNELSAQRTAAAGRAGAPATREAAAQFLADLFYSPLLAEMRKSPFGREYSHGGRGEDVFGEQLDQQLGEAVARSDRSGLAEVVANGLGRRDAATRASAPAATASEGVR